MHVICVMLTGGDKLRYNQRSQVQPGDQHFPPVARQQAGVWPKLQQQGGCRPLCPRHGSRPRGT